MISQVEKTKYLFVASTGGHLAELFRLSQSWSVSESSLWVTFESEQSVSLLAGRRVVYLPYVRSRDLVGVFRTLVLATRILRRESFDAVVSTGAAIALGVLPAAKARRIPAKYIESVSRVVGPSTTGRIVGALRLAQTYTQHPGWSNMRWRPHPSVLTHFQPVPKDVAADSVAPLKIFVTLGTIHPYRFDSLIDTLLETGLMNEATVWQLGDTWRDGLPGKSVRQVSATDFARFVKEADVVVTHAGVGTILGMLEAGIHPVVAPRRKARREHVDDHQLQIANLLNHLGVATVLDATSIGADSILAASRLATIPGTPRAA